MWIFCCKKKVPSGNVHEVRYKLQIDKDHADNRRNIGLLRRDAIANVT